MNTELDVLAKNFNEKAGILYPKVLGYIPTIEEMKAITYLCDEWDFAYVYDFIKSAEVLK